MTCDFTYLATFQSYQDDRKVLINGYVNGTPFAVGKISAFNAGSLDQQASTYRPGLL